MTSVFILLTAYYIIKPVREALILSGAGAEMKSYVGAGQALMFLVLVPLYSAFAGRTNRIRLLNGVLFFFISNLAVFYVLGRMHFPLGVIFFLWMGLFNLMLVAQFWALASDIYNEEQGKRLFAIVGIGSSLGAIAGSRLSEWLFRPLGPFALMLVAAALLLVCVIFTNWIHVRESRGGRRRRQLVNQPLGGSGGFQLVLRHRYLLLIAAMVLIGNFVNTNGEFILGKTVAEHAKVAADTQAYIGEFYAGFYFWVNLAGAALQLFAVSRLMKYVGIGPALFVLPVIALGSYAALAFVPVLSLIRVAKIAENSTDYSIQNTIRHALFLNTSRDAKYKAQSAIESFFWRTGDALSALLVYFGTRMAFDVSKFAVTNTLFVLLWLGIAAAIVRLRDDRSAPKSNTRRAA